MSKSITAWRLVHPRRRLARCTVAQRAGAWQTVVWNHEHIVMWERHHTRQAALDRAAAIRDTLVARGWVREPGDTPWAGLRRRLVAARTRAAAARRWGVGLTAGTLAVWLWRTRPGTLKALVKRLHPEPASESRTFRIAACSSAETAALA
jgi:hypothetical protein